MLAASGILYVSTLAPGMLRGDSGEFQWAMASLNVAHATGYPLFTLAGYFWHLVPLSPNVAWQLNLLAPLFGALAAATLFVLVRTLTGQGAAALGGAAFFALAPVIWFNASLLEVYTLHAFLLALILYLLWRWSRRVENNNPLFGAFLVLGLSLAHHRLTVLALPAFVYFLWATDHRFFFRLKRLALCLLLLAPGLALYLYVPLRLVPSGFTLDYAWNDIILGKEYAGSLLKELQTAPLFDIPFRNLHIGLLLAVPGALGLFRRARAFNLALWLIYLVDVGFTLVYSVPDVEVFMTPALVVLAIWIGSGTALLAEWLAARLPRLPAPALRMTVAAVATLAALWGLTGWNTIHAAVANEAAPEARARAIASAGLPQAALLELDWETATALRFLQSTEHERPDLEARLIGVNQRDEYWRVLENVDAGRPVLLEQGVVWTRAPAGYATTPQTDQLVLLHPVPFQITQARHAISPELDFLGYSLSSDAFVIYWRLNGPLSRDLASYVHWLDAQGAKIGQEDRAACCEAVYGYRTSEWEPGRVYADRFRPPPPNAAKYEIGAYELVNGDIEPYGESLMLTLGPK